MSSAEYAAAETSLGARVRQQDGTFWRQVRPFFYRPLLPFEAPGDESAGAGFHRPWEGYQHVVKSRESANSTLNFRMFRNTHEYDLGSLKAGFRRQVRVAARNYVIRPILELDEFKARGHEAYLSFYRRTSYGYLASRKRREGFHWWAETLFGHEKIFLLGGYGSTGLVAVSVLYWVGTSLIYATFFSDTVPLRGHVADLMLHAIRELAATTPGIDQIFTGPYQGGSGQDHFYLFRGCERVQEPAVLRVPAVARAALRIFLPRQYRKLIGDLP